MKLAVETTCGYVTDVQVEYEKNERLSREILDMIKKFQELTLPRELSYGELIGISVGVESYKNLPDDPVVGRYYVYPNPISPSYTFVKWDGTNFVFVADH